MSGLAIAISASRGSRIDSLLATLRGVTLDRVVATQGTFDFLLHNKLVPGNPEHSLRLRPGHYGGVTQIAKMVVDGTCEAVVLLSDPTDTDIESPEHRTLLRTCVHWEVPLLLTVDDLAQWLQRKSGSEGTESFRSRKHAERKYPKYFPQQPAQSRTPVRNVDDRGRADNDVLTNVGQQTIALVAHDGKKPDMLKFVSRHRALLKRFHRIIATGTTGAHVSELTDLDVMAYDSGPHGGDVQIAYEILAHTCHWLVFFIDTLASHPHEADVRVLQKTSQIPGVFCKAYFSPHTADSAAREFAKLHKVS